MWWSRNLSFFFERETFWSICYSLSLSLSLSIYIYIYIWTYSTYYYYYNYILLHNLKVTFPIEYILKCNLFLWCKSEFSAQLLQSSVSHDPSEITVICWFAAQETFLIIINVKKLVCCLTFWWKIYGRKTCKRLLSDGMLGSGGAVAGREAQVLGCMWWLGTRAVHRTIASVWPPFRLTLGMHGSQTVCVDLKDPFCGCLHCMCDREFFLQTGKNLITIDSQIGELRSRKGWRIRKNGKTHAKTLDSVCNGL